MSERSGRLAKRGAERAKRAWAKNVDAAVLAREKQEWNKEIRMKTKGKSPFYAAVKPKWGREAWLHLQLHSDDHWDVAVHHNSGNSSGNSSKSDIRHGRINGVVQSSGRRWRARMRCSAGVPLAAVLHAEDALLHPSPLCILCGAGVAEDQTHVMSACSL